jgi:hypothetical protein
MTMIVGSGEDSVGLPCDYETEMTAVTKEHLLERYTIK